MYLDVLGKPTIIFNGLKSAFDVLENRASNSSGRPRFIVANEILNGGLSIVFMGYGKLWVQSLHTIGCLHHQRSRIFIAGVRCVVLPTKLSPRWWCNDTTLFRQRKQLFWYPLSLRVPKIESNTFSEPQLPRSCPYCTTIQHLSPDRIRLSKTLIEISTGLHKQRVGHLLSSFFPG